MLLLVVSADIIVVVLSWCSMLLAPPRVYTTAGFRVVLVGWGGKVCMSEEFVTRLTTFSSRRPTRAEGMSPTQVLTFTGADNLALVFACPLFKIRFGSSSQLETVDQETHFKNGGVKISLLKEVKGIAVAFYTPYKCTNFKKKKANMAL